MSWPFETMTEQEVFDKVAEHLLTQNRQSLINGNCVYRGGNGLMCAAGCLIPDNKYYPIMNRKPWNALVTSNMISAHCFDLIASLQRVHDCWPVAKWKLRLKELALIYKLEFKFDNFVPGEQT
jgi:hypothetical protein